MMGSDVTMDDQRRSLPDTLARSSAPARLWEPDPATEDRGAWGEDCPCGDPLPYLAYLDRVTPPAGTCAHDAPERAGA